MKKLLILSVILIHITDYDGVFLDSEILHLIFQEISNEEMHG